MILGAEGAQVLIIECYGLHYRCGSSGFVRSVGDYQSSLSLQTVVVNAAETCVSWRILNRERHMPSKCISVNTLCAEQIVTITIELVDLFRGYIDAPVGCLIHG